MNDLGFGIVDRRSVLVVLFTLGVSKILFGYDLPIDTSNLISAFIGLLVLTGFIYAIRSILRLGLAMFTFLIRLPCELIVNLLKRKQTLRGLRGLLIVSFTSLRNSFLFGFFFPSFIIRDWKYKIYYVEEDYSVASKPFAIQLGALGILDRILLVGIALSATIPSLAGEIKIVGLLGISIMLLVYTVTGSFSFILDDAILRGEIKQQEAIDAARNPNINFPTSITAYPPSRDYGI